MDWFFFKKLTWVQVMLACEDYPSLKDRQLTKIEREFPKWLGKSFSDHKTYGKCFILEPEYGNGVICFRNLDDPSKYQSAEFAAILVDELTKNPYDTFNDLRMRLRWSGLKDDETIFIGGTNPGGIGHAYCKSFWIDKIYPEEYQTPVDYTKKFTFVQSKAEDNPHLDQTYWQMLNTLPAHLRPAFKDGSWDTFVGQALQEWSRVHHVIKSVPVPKDAPKFMTFDWGFGAPFSVGWWWLDADGRFYRFNEWYGWNGTPNQGLRLADSEIAHGIIKKEMAMGLNVESNGIVNPQIIRLCDPTCFNKKPDYKGGGQGTSTAEEFRRLGLVLRPGDASRSLKLRQFHQRLLVTQDENKKFSVPMMQIYENCIHFIRTIPNLVINPNNPEDIDTDGEDHCLSGDTLVLTNHGEKKISELVGTEGFVQTVGGRWTKYHDCRKTRKNADVIKIDFSNGRSVICTKDHKFMLLNNNFINAIDLLDESCYISIIQNTRRQLWKSKLLAIPFKNLMERITGCVEIIFRGKERDYTGLYGNIITERYQNILKSTIKTTIEKIIKFKTLFLMNMRNIVHFMQNLEIIQNGLKPCTEGLPYGMEVNREKNGISYNMIKIVNQSLTKLSVKYANIVEMTIRDKNFQSIVQESANKDRISLIVEQKKGFVLSVLNRFSQMVCKVKKLVQQNASQFLHGKLVSPVKIQYFGKQDVYCLDVEDSSHAFAINGGILVHNCYDEAALLCMARPLQIAGMNKWNETLNEKPKSRPKDISEVAQRERENIFNQINEDISYMEIY
jgi:hypothetical protein